MERYCFLRSKVLVSSRLHIPVQNRIKSLPI